MQSGRHISFGTRDVPEHEPHGPPSVPRQRGARPARPEFANGAGTTIPRKVRASRQPPGARATRQILKGGVPGRRDLGLFSAGLSGFCRETRKMRDSAEPGGQSVRARRVLKSLFKPHVYFYIFVLNQRPRRCNNAPTSVFPPPPVVNAQSDKCRRICRKRRLVFFKRVFL